MIRSAVAVLLLLLPVGCARGGPAPVMVYAAASTGELVAALAKKLEDEGRGKTAVSLSSSSTLARQIEHGAPADLFLSANVDWMDHLQRGGHLEPGTRSDLWTNRLVIVTGQGGADVALDGPPPGCVAMGDPSHVPAGIYAKQALERLGAWPQWGPRIVATGNVRGALTLVARGECPVGIVYATDVAIASRVRVVQQIPATAHDAVVYPVAVVRGRLRPAVTELLDLLKSKTAAAEAARFGFGIAL